jgi:hypothetical protein
VANLLLKGDISAGCAPHSKIPNSLVLQTAKFQLSFFRRIAMAPTKQVPYSPPPPPKDFDPTKATDEELRRANFPPRPKSDGNKAASQLWQTIANRKPGFMQSKLELVSSSGLEEAKQWSGAVLKQGGPFVGIEAGFTVPQPYPASGDGSYQYYAWVGIDGYTDNESLKCGIQTTTLTNDRTSSTEVLPALLFRGAGDKQISVFVFKDLVVKPGDYIAAATWWDTTDATKGNGFIYNFNSNYYVVGVIDAPSGVTLEGNNAEWIMAAPQKTPTQTEQFPNFGSIVFLDTIAVNTQSQAFDTTNADLVQAEDTNDYAVRVPQAVQVYSLF